MGKDGAVFADGRYILGWKKGLPFISINGEEYRLTCHPYEPCLYVTDRSGRMTAVHNAFDPSSVLDRFADGDTVTSITGTEYDASDFCEMVENAARFRDIQIDEAEKVFRGRSKKKKTSHDKKEEKAEAKFQAASDTPLPVEGEFFETDPAYRLIEEYPDCVVDFCLVKNSHAKTGYNAHRLALVRACGKLFTDDGGDAIWRFDAGKADAKRIGADELFAAASKDGPLNFRKAFLDPPYANGYTDSDFDKITKALFPKGTDALEVYEWTTGWSDYFDEGREWWGTLCLTVYDEKLDRFVVITASATD